MYTVLIADDEPRICELIKHLVHWSELELTLLGSVHDGQELFEQIVQQRPDIVITDVVMPRMTGLEIIQKVGEEGIRCNFIIISGHRYFEFVQDAIKHGACDYLLKPIDGEELNATLKKICDKLTDSLREKLTVSNHHKEIQRSRQILRRHLITNSFLSGTEKFDELKRLNREYSVAFRPGAFQAMILAFEAKKEADRAALELVSEKAVYAIEARLRDIQAYVISYVVDQYAYFLINYERIAEDAGQLSDRVFGEAGHEAGLFPGISVTLGYGTVERCFDQFPKTIRLANLAIRERVKLGRNRVIGFKEVERYDQRIGVDDFLNREQMQQLAHIFDGLNQEKYEAWLDEAAARFSDKLPGAVWYELCVRIGELFDQVIQSHKEVDYQFTTSLTSELIASLEQAPRNQLMKALAEPVCARMRVIREEKQEQSNRPVRLAKEYIGEHYMEPIRLEDVAGQVYLHPAYLSHIFKEAVGIGFSDYVANCRLERAKYLLTHTNDTIYSVARQVGYTEPRAFSKFFLKNVGVKPSDYRRMYS